MPIKPVQSNFETLTDTISDSLNVVLVRRCPFYFDVSFFFVVGLQSCTQIFFNVALCRE